MLRLLQGDVGSGKTLVAVMAMLAAVESGAQAALLAPTEILARQHHATLLGQLDSIGVRVAILTGREKGRARDSVLMGLADGSIDILVGTHAIFQEKVAYKNLGLAVIDEQHRFGVSQRLLLASKAEHPPHLLVMTATPIPRTLTLTQYGEMDVSRIDEMPPGRTPVETRVISEERLPDVVDGLGRHIAGGGQAYWVCPLVEESEKSDAAAAEERARVLQPALRRGQGRPGPRAHERAGQGCGHGALRLGRARGAGRDDGDRGRRRRAQRDADDRRGRRALRPRPAPPAARPRRAGRGQEHLPADPRADPDRRRPRAPGPDARDQRRLPHRRGGSAAARARRDPRHAAVGRGGVPRRDGRRTSQSLRRSRRATRSSCSTATAGCPARAGRRRASASICSSATRRWG